MAKVIGTKVSDQLAQTLQAIATTQGMSVSALLRQLLTAYIQKGESETRLDEAIKSVKDVPRLTIKSLTDTIKDDRKAHQAERKAHKAELRAEQKAHEKERTKLIKEALKTKNPIVKLIKPPSPPKAPKQPRLPALCPHGCRKGSCLTCYNDRKAEMKRKEEEREKKREDREYIRLMRWSERNWRERQRAIHGRGWRYLPR